MAIAPPTKMAETNPTSWIDAFAQQVGRYDPTTQTISNNSPGAQASIEAILSAITGQVAGGDFSKDAALKDSDMVLAQIFKDFKEQALPQIFQQGGGTGGYNSSTVQLLANDAFARAVAAGQAAKLKTVNDYAANQTALANAGAQATRAAANPSQKTTVKPSAGSSLLSAASLAGKAAPFAFSKVKDLARQRTLDSGGMDLYRGTGMSPTDGAFGSSVDFGAAATPFGGNAVSNLQFTSSPFAFDANEAIFANAMNPVSENMFASAFAPSEAVDFGSGIVSDIAGESADVGLGLASSGVEDAFGSFGGDVAGEIAGDAIGGGIPFIGPAVSLAQGNVAGAAGSLIGGAIGGPPGAIVGGLLSNIIGDDSVICTELRRQGLLSKELYEKDIRFAKANLSPTMLRGYRFIATPIVKQMRKSNKLSNFLLWFVIHRANSLGTRGFNIGRLIRVIFEPMCYFIGLFVPEVDYRKELYGTN